MSEEETVAGAAEHAPMFELLLTNAHRLAIEMTQELAFEHVSVMGLVVVQMLARARPPRSPRELAAALGCSRAAATQLVDRLVRDGFVERAFEAHDRRARVLQLTEDGRIHGDLAGEALERCMASFTEQFSEEDKVSLRALLARLERGADWHRAMRMWRSTEARPGRRPSIHVR